MTFPAQGGFESHSVGLPVWKPPVHSVCISNIPGRDATEVACPSHTELSSFVLAYTKDNLAHVIYPGGVGKEDWVHDLPLLIAETRIGRPK